jgi:hypothetical protein
MIAHAGGLPTGVWATTRGGGAETAVETEVVTVAVTSAVTSVETELAVIVVIPSSLLR